MPVYYKEIVRVFPRVFQSQVQKARESASLPSILKLKSLSMNNFTDVWAYFWSSRMDKIAGTMRLVHPRECAPYIPVTSWVRAAEVNPLSPEEVPSPKHLSSADIGMAQSSSESNTWVQKKSWQNCLTLNAGKEPKFMVKALPMYSKLVTRLDNSYRALAQVGLEDTLMRTEMQVLTENEKARVQAIS